MKKNTKETQKIISVVNLKGGCGRSTLATNLAGELSKLDSTALIDTDLPQGTSASWFAIRQEAGRSGDLTLATATGHRELITEVEARGERYVVLDSPPRLAELARAMVMLSDLVLIPVATSAAEVWATSDLMTLLAEARKVRPIEARLVWTRHRAGTRLARELVGQVNEVLDLPFMKSALSLRVAYQEALGLGLTATETADKNAREEVNGLVGEVVKLLRKSK